MPSTIRDLSELTAVAVDDYLLISDTSDVTNRDKRISTANLQAGIVKPSGTITVGRLAQWASATTLGATAYGGGEVALLNTPGQSFTVLKTFSAGLSFGQSTLTYYEEGPWTPTIRFGGNSVGQSYSTRAGTYTRIGNQVFCTMAVNFSNKGTSTGTADVSGLPYTVGLSAVTSPRWGNMATTFINMWLVPSTGGTVIAIRAMTAASGTAGVAIADTDFTTSGNLAATFSYSI